MTQTNAFDGIFDDTERGVREKVRCGEVVAFVRSNCLESQAVAKLGMSGPFGSYPARPTINLE